jgi:hypothetical protein
MINDRLPTISALMRVRDLARAWALHYSIVLRF